MERGSTSGSGADRTLILYVNNLSVSRSPIPLKSMARGRTTDSLKFGLTMGRSMAIIRDLAGADVACIPEVLGGPAWNGGLSKWSRYWEQHLSGARTCLVAQEAEKLVGYVSVVWRSQHEPFRRAGIPEIQDLVVADFARGRGIGGALVAECETRANDLGHAELGIGFGLYADYGAAQRLYVRSGYVPDGLGLTWNNKSANAGDMVRVDDDLVLWLRKRLA